MGDPPQQSRFTAMAKVHHDWTGCSWICRKRPLHPLVPNIIILKDPSMPYKMECHQAKYHPTATAKQSTNQQENQDHLQY